MELRGNKYITSTDMEKNISGTGNSICKDSEFGKSLAVSRDERRPKAPGARGK